MHVLTEVPFSVNKQDLLTKGHKWYCIQNHHKSQNIKYSDWWRKSAPDPLSARIFESDWLVRHRSLRLAALDSGHTQRKKESVPQTADKRIIYVHDKQRANSAVKMHIHNQTLPAIHRVCHHHKHTLNIQNRGRQRETDERCSQIWDSLLSPHQLWLCIPSDLQSIQCTTNSRLHIAALSKLQTINRVHHHHNRIWTQNRAKQRDKEQT